MKIKKSVFTSVLLLSSLSIQAGNVVPVDMLAAHNSYRSAVGSTALKWSDDLQSKAQKWADNLKAQGCNSSHSGPGENLYYASAKRSATSKDSNGNWIWEENVQAIDDKKVTDSWGSEKQWFDYSNNECNAPDGEACGHYTQVVWKSSTEVGCGNAVCGDSSQVWVCNYSPAGNVTGQKPY